MELSNVYIDYELFDLIFQKLPFGCIYICYYVNKIWNKIAKETLKNEVLYIKLNPIKKVNIPFLIVGAVLDVF